jgi:hypothetical protein
VTASLRLIGAFTRRGSILLIATAAAILILEDFSRSLDTCLIPGVREE